MTRQEVADFLKVSLVTLFNLRKKGVLKPTHQIGRKPLYSRESLLEQIELRSIA